MGTIGLCLAMPPGAPESGSFVNNEENPVRYVLFGASEGGRVQATGPTGGTRVDLLRGSCSPGGAAFFACKGVFSVLISP